LNFHRCASAASDVHGDAISIALTLPLVLIPRLMVTMDCTFQKQIDAAVTCKEREHVGRDRAPMWEPAIDQPAALASARSNSVFCR
jgi:hypothetical protein